MHAATVSPFALSSLLLLLICSSSPAQAPASLIEQLHQAAESTTLDAPGSSPFHLKLSVEVSPQLGRVADKGTVELWWNSHDHSRTVYDLSRYHATIVRSGSQQLRTAGVEDAPYIVDHMLAEIVDPVPDNIKGVDFDVTATKLPFGKIGLDCILTKPLDAKPKDITGGSYCFDDQRDLRIVAVSPDQFNLRQKLGTLGKIRIPLVLQYTFLRNQVAIAEVQTLQSQKKPYLEVLDTKDLVPDPAPAIALPSQTSNGHLSHKQDPIYPLEAKEKHISGTVLLHGIIGVDGKVRSLSLIGSPDDSLTKSALEAVRKWKYEPYLLSGVPAEVSTTIKVNYAFGTR